ncbi:MAG: phenylacetate--CoA ligase family protein [Actinomycetota bacterium]
MLLRPDVQALPREELLLLQSQRLRELFARAYEVPFFKRLLDGAGIGPDDVKSADDLLRVPRITKQDLRDSEDAVPPLGDYRGAPVERCVRLSTSTGTTGRPTISIFTAHDLAVEYDAAGRSFARQGYQPGEIVTHAHPGGLNGGQALLGGALEAYGCLNVPVGPPMSKADAQRAIALWRELRPHRYEMFGPALHTFWETAKETGLDPAADLGMPPPAELPPWRTVSAGLECFAFLGSACEEMNGAHVCEDEAVVEAIDPETGEHVPDGERGYLVVTTLTKHNFLIRYDLEDLVRLDRSPCPCGETHLRAFWDGRAKDIVEAAGRSLLPMDVWLVLRTIEEVAEPAVEYQLVRSADTSVLRVRVETPAPSPGLERRVASTLEERLTVPVALELLAAGALPRPAYKPAPVVDE